MVSKALVAEVRDTLPKKPVVTASTAPAVIAPAGCEIEVTPRNVTWPMPAFRLSLSVTEAPGNAPFNAFSVIVPFAALVLIVAPAF
jgi:hypothetical protein